MTNYDYIDNLIWLAGKMDRCLSNAREYAETSGKVPSQGHLVELGLLTCHRIEIERELRRRRRIHAKYPPAAVREGGPDGSN